MLSGFEPCERNLYVPYLYVLYPQNKDKPHRAKGSRSDSLYFSELDNRANQVFIASHQCITIVLNSPEQILIMEQETTV